MITIKNYNEDLNHGVFYGWDMAFVWETGDFYSFEFMNRQDKSRVYVLLHREPTPDRFYEVYLADMNDMWKRTVHLDITHLGKSKFYNFIESVIDDEYPLPF